MRWICGRFLIWPGGIIKQNVVAELKTKANKASVNKFIQGVANAQRKADAKTVLKLMQDVTGEKPTMWGPSIIGFGTHHYDCLLYTSPSPRDRG